MSRLFIDVKDTIFDGATLEAARTSDALEISGASKLIMYVDLGYAGSTRCDIYPEVSRDGGTTWCRVEAETVSSGASTLDDLIWQRTNGAAADDYVIEWDCSGYRYVRFVADSGAGAAAAGDTITAHIELVSSSN